MIRITLKHGDKEKKLLAPETKKVGDFLKEAEVDFSDEDSVIIGDRLLQGDEIDKSFIDLDFAKSSELTIRIEADLPWKTSDSGEESFGSVIYPPKARIIGCACIIVSSFSPNALRDYQRYLPETLTVRDEAGDPTFAISLDEKGPGSLNEYGAVFSKRTTSDGNATITILIDPECDDPEEAVRESIGAGILKLIDLEEHLMKKHHEIVERKALLDEYISVT